MSYAIALAPVPPIANWVDLIEAVKAEADRDDIDDGRVQEFIQRAEARMNRVLRVPDMEKMEEIVVTDGVAGFPLDYLQLTRVFDASGCTIPGVEPSELMANRRCGIPCHAIIGNSLRVSPASSNGVTIIYYAKIPTLSEAQAVNWLLDSHPDIYWYACLTLLSSHIADEESVTKYKGAWDEALQELIDDGARRRHGGPLRMRATVSQTRGARV